jgi:hypothetical protein
MHPYAGIIRIRFIGYHLSLITKWFKAPRASMLAKVVY